MRVLKGMGWRPDKPDINDFKYRVAAPAALPMSVDLRPQMPPVYDQGSLGSCTANAIGAAVEHTRIKQGFKDFTPSRLFIYYNERVMEGTVGVDAGAEIRDGIKSVVDQGACHEGLCPYTISRFTRKPSVRAYKHAMAHQITQYQRVDNRSVEAIKTPLAEGHPVVFGFSVYDSFESDQVAKDGVVPMPQKGEELLGGHAVLAVGYDDGSKMFIVRNSWGPKWGREGYCMMPYEYLTNTDLADDFWVIQMAEG